MKDWKKSNPTSPLGARWFKGGFFPLPSSIQLSQPFQSLKEWVYPSFNSFPWSLDASPEGGRLSCFRLPTDFFPIHFWTLFRTPFQWPPKPSEDGLESVLDGPCKKINGFGSPNGLQNWIQNGSRNGSRAIPDPNTYKRRKHYYSNAKWLWVPLLIHRFSLKIQPKLVPKLVPKRVPFRNPGFFRFWRSEAVSRRFQTTL